MRSAPAGRSKRCTRSRTSTRGSSCRSRSSSIEEAGRSAGGLDRAGRADRCARSSARVSPTAASATLVERDREGRSAIAPRARTCVPVYKRVDTCAAEFSTSHGLPVLDATRKSARRRPTDRRKIMILGGGPNRIGQGIEFDYCCVHAALALREDGFETIMVNCNPETVSTDYDTSDRLFFEPLTLEDVLGDHREGKAGRRDRAVRRPDAAEAGARAGSSRRADHRHHARMRSTSPKTASASSSWSRRSSSSSRRTAPRATKSRRIAAGARSRLSRSSCARPSCWAAARWKWSSPKTTCASTCPTRCNVSNDSPVLLDRFLDVAIEVDVDADLRRRGRADRRHHGAHRAGRRALGRLRLLAAAVQPVAEFQEELREQTRKLAQELQRRRPR